MFNLKLFIGFVPDEAFQTELQQTNPYLISLFIGREEYLQEIVHKGRRYLGKYLSSYPTFDQLEDMEKHVLSLLNHLAPRYPFSTNAFVLITCDGS